jgi:hypothetical protein
VHRKNILIYIQQAATLHCLFYPETALHVSGGILCLKCDGTRAETRFRLSAKRTSPFKSAGAWVQSNTSSRGVRISVSNVGCTKFRGVWRVLATHSIRQFSLHFPSRASPCAITFQLDSTTTHHQERKQLYLRHLVFVRPLLLSAASGR